jgi:uncharacterized membrane protein
MKRSYSLVISLLLFAIAAGILYVGLSYISGDATTQTSIEQIFVSMLPFLLIFSVAASCIIWIAALIAMLLNPTLSSTDKIIWTLVILFLHVIGAFIYFLVIPFYRPSSPGPLRRA